MSGVAQTFCNYPANYSAITLARIKGRRVLRRGVKSAQAARLAQ